MIRWDIWIYLYLIPGYENPVTKLVLEMEDMIIPSWVVGCVAVLELFSIFLIFLLYRK